MSASNWAVCPRCKRRHEAGAARLRVEAAEAYGKASVDDWIRMDREALAASAPFDKTTFREDYEIYGAEEGEIRVRYQGGCEVCGLACDFKHTVPIEGLGQ